MLPKLDLQLPAAQSYTQLLNDSFPMQSWLSYVAVYQVFVVCELVFLTVATGKFVPTQFGTFPKLTLTGPRPAVRQYSKPKANRGGNNHKNKKG